MEKLRFSAVECNGVNAGQTGMHTAEPLVYEFISFETETAIGKFQSLNSENPC
jgi:hypothetical protein